MNKKQSKPELHCYFDNPNKPEDVEKLLIKMCIEHILRNEKQNQIEVQ